MSRSDLDGLGYRGKTAVLTGGASGMGEAAARLLGELGATVHIADIAEPTVQCASYVPLDLSDPASIAAATASLGEAGPIDFLFPVAGIPPHAGGPLHCLLVNYAGTRMFTEALLPQVRDGGSVALIASVAARYWQQHLAEHLEAVAIAGVTGIEAYYEARPEALRDGYSTSKELLFVWIQQVAPRLAAERRIRINCTAPCPVDTAFMATTIPRMPPGFMESYPLPLLGRMPTAEEQAWSLLLLASPLNVTVTGTMLYTDQGYAGGLVTGSLRPAGAAALEKNT
jgi:NAD(P)-dependent dehydrogenase (short-subunit alcohol dehydrogenase family)